VIAEQAYLRVKSAMLESDQTRRWDEADAGRRITGITKE